MFVLGTTSTCISNHPLDLDTLMKMKKASLTWRTKLRNYKIGAYVLLALPLILLASYVSWMEMAIGLIIYFAGAMFAEFHIQNMVSNKHNVSLQIDEEEFAKPYDENLVEPIDNQTIHLRSDVARSYLQNTKNMKRQLTQLDVDIIEYLNRSEKRNGQSI